MAAAHALFGRAFAATASTPSARARPRRSDHLGARLARGALPSTPRERARVRPRGRLRRGDLHVRAAGAFTKLIEIPAARGVAKGLMIPARRFMDGASASEDVLAAISVRASAESVPFAHAPLLPLSGYDVGEVPFVMQAVCYYRETLDAGLLERALAATLERYPILAGRLDLSDPDPSRKGVRLTNDGANFRVVRDADTPFDALPRDYADESRRFLDYEPWIDIMLGGAPVFTAKVTQLANGGGSVLGVCMSHAVSDGQGFVEFLVAWARRAAGEAHPLGDPVFDRALLPAPPEGMGKDELREMLRAEGFAAKDPTVMLGRAMVAGRVLVPDFLRFPPGNRMMVPVSEADVEKIRNAAGEGASRNEALSAHVWLRLSQLMGLPEGAPLEHVTVVSGRGGKRGLPEMYFGNASVGVCTGRLRAGDYGDVRGVRDAIRPGMRRALMRRSKFLMLTEATFRAGVSAFDFDIDAFMEGRMVWCNNLTDIYLKLYELDFGVGTPTLALPPELNDIVQIQCSRPGADGEAAGENGVEMFVNLPPSIMERLRTPEARAKLAGLD